MTEKKEQKKTKQSSSPSKDLSKENGNTKANLDKPTPKSQFGQP